MPLHISWVTLIVVPVEIGLLLRVWFRGSDPFGDEDMPINRASQLLWPPKVSNYLVVFNIILYIVACLQHPPLGAYSSVVLFVLFPMLGLVLRRWEQ